MDLCLWWSLRYTKKLEIKTIALVLLVIFSTVYNCNSRFSQNHSQNPNIHEFGEEKPRRSGLDPHILKSTGENPSDMFVGDVNNDGYNDIITVNPSSSNIVVTTPNIGSPSIQNICPSKSHDSVALLHRFLKV